MKLPAILTLAASVFSVQVVFAAPTPNAAVPEVKRTPGEAVIEWKYNDCYYKRSMAGEDLGVFRRGEDGAEYNCGSSRAMALTRVSVRFKWSEPLD